MTKNIIVLEMGPLPDSLQPKYGAYAQMFERLMDDNELDVRGIAVWNGEGLPSPDDADGFIISGSKHGVYEEEPWMLATEEFIREAAAKRTPMVGICFGHQLMAKAMGGKVIKSPKGWGLGVNEYEVTPTAKLKDLPKTMKFNAVHQDQVIEKPEGAEIIASSEFCPIGALIYGSDQPNEQPYAITLQPHPEFNEEFTKDLIAVRRGDSFPIAVADAATQSQSQEMNDREWGHYIANFLKQS